MKLLWGDIHNHCGITYGYGSLKNALARAKSHLDFCAVTGHAMWPDIPERTPETAFVVDFHQAGFRKLYDHWPWSTSCSVTSGTRWPPRWRRPTARTLLPSRLMRCTPANTGTTTLSPRTTACP